MTSGRVFVVAWMFLAAVAVNAGGQEITVPEGWIELPADGATTASVFVVVKNPTMYDVYLVSAVSEGCGEGGAPPNGRGHGKEPP